MSDQKQDWPEEKVLEVAEQVKLLLMFSATLIDDLPMLEAMHKQSGEISNTVLTIAPVIGALGGDYEEKHMEAEVRRKRAAALTNLIRTIKETETDRNEFKKSQEAKARARAQLGGILGL